MGGERGAARTPNTPQARPKPAELRHRWEKPRSPPTNSQPLLCLVSSIHPLSASASSAARLQGRWIHFQPSSRWRKGVTPRTSCQFILTLTTTTDSKFPLHLLWMSVDCGKKLVEHQVLDLWPSEKSLTISLRPFDLPLWFVYYSIFHRK